MAIMIKIDKHLLPQLELREIPAIWATIAFYEGNSCIYLLLCPNLRRKLALLKDQMQNEGSFHDLVTTTTYIEIKEYKESIEALISYKTDRALLLPQWQQRLVAQRDYIYLAISAWQFPFVSSSEYTLENWVYLGPFRDRFLLAEYKDSISRILKLPHCETGHYPCDKFERNQCNGWCLALNPEAETGKTEQLDKLEKLLLESYMVPSDAVIQLLQSHQDMYFNDLEFEKAELFREQISLHERYQKWLRFLIAAKNLCFRDDNLVVQNGQLLKARIGETWQDFHFQSLTYKDNELLALDKDLVDEAKILYDYYNRG